MTRHPRREMFLSAAAFETLEDRKLLHAPEISPIPSYNAAVGKVLYVPLTSSYDHGDPVSYSAQSNTGSISVGVRTTKSTWIEMTVAGQGQPMVFQLFDNVAPKTVKTMVGLINSGYFDGQKFHRVIDSFVIQSGDPLSRRPFDADSNEWGTGGPGFEFDDEFNSSAVFTGDGQLAMANGGKDTNGSQFFVTEGPQRALDFNHTIWGQLVRGFATRNAVSAANTDRDGRPSGDVTLSRVRVIANTTDAVLVVNPKAIANGTITVIARGEEGLDSTSFDVAAAADRVNSPPVLIPPAGTYYTPANTPVTVQLKGFDLEGNTIFYNAKQLDGAGLDERSSSISASGLLTVVPKTGFTGKITLYVGAGVAGASTRGSTQANTALPLDGIYDSQLITIAVGDQAIRGTAATIDGLSGAPVTNAVVGTFRDADPRGTPEQYTADINWGDGTQTSGTIVKSRNGVFSVLGNHTYAEGSASGNYPVTVDITSAGGAGAILDSVASVKPLATLKAGVLTVNGTNGADRIGVGVVDGMINATVNRVTRAFDAASVTQIRIFGYDGNDLLALSEAGVVGSLIDGGLGNDVILGSDGADTLSGGAGRDTVNGRDGNDRVAGGDDADTIFGGNGRDRIAAGLGNDIVYGEGSPDIISGEEGNDTLLGGSGNDAIYGNSGNDVINVLGGGTDLADGGPGRNIGKYDEGIDTVAKLVLV